MEFVKSKSTNKDDYEILIRKRGENDYASYCPQLNFMIKGFDHSQVKEYMSDYIDRHINFLLYGTEMPLQTSNDDLPGEEDSLVVPNEDMPDTTNNEQ